MKPFLALYALLWLVLLLLAVTGRSKLFFALYDAWIGAFWDGKKRALYVCPLPCVVFKIAR